MKKKSARARRPAYPWNQLSAIGTPVLLCLCASALCRAKAQQGSAAPPAPPAPPAPAVEPSPLAQMPNGRAASDNSQILTTGIRSPGLASNHALIITVSEYPRSPLPGVLTDRKLGIELAQRFLVAIEELDS